MRVEQLLVEHAAERRSADRPEERPRAVDNWEFVHLGAHLPRRSRDGADGIGAEMHGHPARISRASRWISAHLGGSRACERRKWTSRYVHGQRSAAIDVSITSRAHERARVCGCSGLRYGRLLSCIIVS